MKLIDLIKAVDDRKLSRPQLEEYRDNMSSLYAQMQWELADIRKAKAIYFDVNKLPTDKATERKWQVTREGLREIELTHYAKGTEKVLSSLKNRIYDLI
jgi:hypothetical protein